MFHTGDLPIGVNILLFAAAAAGVWFAGSRLALYGDVIAEKAGIDSTFVGLIFLAAATELPELVTTLVAASEGNATLVVNNMFGGITMQTAILAVADMFIAYAALTFHARQSILLLQAGLLTFMLGLLLGIDLIGDQAVLLHIGYGTLLLTAAYIGAIVLLRNYESHDAWRPLDIPSSEEQIKAGPLIEKADVLSLPRLVRLFVAAAAAILFCGVFLVYAAEALAVQSGLGSSFVGATLLAGSTSLPELSTTIAAVRLGAHSMAISNIFGSNLIMFALLLPADLVFTKGPLLHHVDSSARFAVISGIVVTAIYLIGLLIRKKKKVLRMGLDSAFVLLIYLITLVIFYWLR